MRKCPAGLPEKSHHMRLLSKSSAADLTHEGFLSGVDLQMLLEVESFRIDKKTTDWTALVVRPEQKQYLSSDTDRGGRVASGLPVIIHVDVEVVQA